MIKYILLFALASAASLDAAGSVEEELPVPEELAFELSSLGFVLPEVPLPAPDLGFDSLRNKTVMLREAEGSLVMLNFWATWCPPCREEMASMQKLWENLGGENFILYAANVGERKDTVESYIGQKGYTFPVLLDPEGFNAGVFQTRGIPATWLIGPEGMILGRYIGSRDWNTEEIVRLFRKIMRIGSVQNAP